MASLTAFLQTAAQYWYIPAAVVVLGVLFAYGCAYFRALRPREGTLEWIAFHDRPHLALDTYGTLSRRDAAGICAVMLLTLGAWVGALLPALLDGPDTSGHYLVSALAYNSALPMLSAALGYALMKQLSGSTAAAVLGASLLGLNLLADPVTTLFMTAAALAACRFTTRAESHSFAANVPYLLLCAGALTVGCYFRPALSLFAAAILALLVIACILRFINRGRSDGYLPKTLGVFLAAVAGTAILVFLPAAALWGRPFPGVLLAPFTGEYYVLVAQRVSELFTGLLGWRGYAVLSGLYYDWPLLVTGVLSVLVMLVTLLRRRDGRGLLLTLLLLGAAAMWLLGGDYAMPAICAAALCCIWSALLQRGKRALAVAGAAVLLGTTVVFNTFFFWYPQLADLINQLWRR